MWIDHRDCDFPIQAFLVPSSPKGSADACEGPVLGAAPGIIFDSRATKSALPCCFYTAEIGSNDLVVF